MIEARNRHQALSEELEQLLRFGFKEDQGATDSEGLEENLRALKATQTEFDQIWEDLERNAEKELLFTRELFDVIQEQGRVIPKSLQ